MKRHYQTLLKLLMIKYVNRYLVLHHQIYQPIRLCYANEVSSSSGVRGETEHAGLLDHINTVCVFPHSDLIEENLKKVK